MAVYDKKAAAERRKTLQQSEERFRALIQHSADAIQLISADAKILYSSDSVEHVLGYKPEEILGDGPAKYLHPDDLPLFIERFTALLQNPGGQDSLVYRVRHKDGSWAWIEATGSNYLHDPQIRAIVGNFRNITRRKQAEERQRLLNEAGEKLVTSLDHQITLQEIAQLLVPSMADYCRIALVDERGRIKQIAVNHIDPGKIALVRELYEQYKGRVSSTYGLNSLLETGQSELISAVTPEVVAPSAQENPALLSIIQALGLTSYMGTPLIARDRVIGAITFSSVRTERHYTQEDLAFAQELARRIALTLDNAWLYRETQDELAERKRVEQHLRFLSEASKLLSSSLDYQATLTHVVNLAVPQIADWCAVEMLDDTGQFRQVAVSHKDPQKVAWAQELRKAMPPQITEQSGYGLVIKTKQSGYYPIVTDDMLVRSARNSEELEMLRALGMTSVMIVPLTVQEKVTGTISFVMSESGKHFSEADLTMAEEVAARAALAIANARLYSEAQKAIALRDDFISIASHELRTPVTSLKLYVQVLRKQLARLGEESVVHSLSKMDAQLNKLTMLIKDLLNVSRIELGRLDFQEDPFDLNEVVRETVEQIQPTTNKHGIRVEGQASRPAWGDKDRIGQVLTNLLTNAIKYSPQADTVIVQIMEGQDAAVVNVQDFGIGIEKEHIHHIFDRFYRVSDPDEKTYPGLGIGLYISHEIIKRHGGSLSVESEKGRGSVFSFTLPYTSSTFSPHDAPASHSIT